MAPGLPSSAGAESPIEISLGLAAGPSIPGDQDLKLKRHDATLLETDFLFTEDVDESVGPFVSVFLTGWGRADFWEHLGFQTEVAYWSTRVEGRSWVDMRPPIDPNPVAPFTTFDQERVSVFLSLLGRFPVWGDRTAPIARRPFLFAGLGGGGVFSSIERGFSGWDGGLQLIGGTSVPVSRRVRLRLDFRYLMAPDAQPPSDIRWRVDTSGTRVFPFMVHYDTRFFVLTLGVEFGL